MGNAFMKKNDIQKHIYRDYLTSSIILFSVTLSICMLIGSYIPIIHKRSIAIQIANTIISIIISSFITKNNAEKFDLLLHKYVYKSKL